MFCMAWGTHGPSGVAGSSLWVSQLVSPTLAPAPHPTRMHRLPRAFDQCRRSRTPGSSFEPSSFLKWRALILLTASSKRWENRVRTRSTWRAPRRVRPLSLKQQRPLCDQLSPRGGPPCSHTLQMVPHEPASAFPECGPFTCTGPRPSASFFLL